MACLIFFLAVVVLAQGTRGSQERIIGGSLVPYGSIKYQVSIRYFGKHICSGALIKPMKVVTAARCVKGFESELPELSVLGGTVHLSGSGGEVRTVESLKVHHRFQGGRDYDIAVMKLKANFSSLAEPIALIPANIELHRTLVELSGWGSTYVDGPYNPDLLKTTLKALSIEDCRAIYPHISSRNICCENQSGILGVACAGDSGSPVVVKINNIKHLVAVVSGVGFCEKYGFVDIFTNIQNNEIATFIHSVLY